MLARVVIHVLARVVLHVLAHVLLHVLAECCMALARVVVHMLARALPHVLARVLLHVLARVIIHVHDYYLKTCLQDQGGMQQGAKAKVEFWHFCLRVEDWDLSNNAGILLQRLERQAERQGLG